MVPEGMLKTLPPKERLHSKVVLAETGSTISIRKYTFLESNHSM